VSFVTLNILPPTSSFIRFSARPAAISILFEIVFHLLSLSFISLRFFSIISTIDLKSLSTFSEQKLSSIA